MAFGIGQDRAIVGRLQHRGEHLAAVDDPAAIDPFRYRAQMAFTDQGGAGRLGEVAGNQGPVFDRQFGDEAAGVFGYVFALGQRADHGGVHVEGERRRRAAFRQRFVG